MIQVTINFTSMELKIVHAEDMDDLERDLQWIKDNIDAADRSYLDDKKLFVVKNYEKYKHLRPVDQAIRIRREQPTLL